MRPRPRHLTPDRAAQFQDSQVVEAYQYRAPYPDEVFAILGRLILDRPRRVLDVGCGRGDIARRLLVQADAVDAVDISAAMIDTGRRLPRGDDPRLTWILGPAESAPLQPPYALITAGSSLHWMDWDVVLPRFRDVLSPSGALAILDVAQRPRPWDAAARTLIQRYSYTTEFEAFNLIDELESRGLFRRLGSAETAPVRFAQPLRDYVESIHSMNGFSRQRMAPDAASAFDAELGALVAGYCPQAVELEIVGRVLWGAPGHA